MKLHKNGFLFEETLAVENRRDFRSLDRFAPDQTKIEQLECISP
uniref:Uncharacterized protein n=1 Tax=Anguilla anguilla TaxID=7936 RepID=A0A0E9UB54_ANGAN